MCVYHHDNFLSSVRFDLWLKREKLPISIVIGLIDEEKESLEINANANASELTMTTNGNFSIKLLNR